MLSEWVDFEYSVNGKMYQFSLPGGGFVSLTDLVEVLGIIGDTNPDKNDEEIDAVEEQDANGLLDVMASDAAKKFVADVASVEFSSPELVWVGKVENETIVDALKEVNGLECEYSAELTIEQIEKINAQTVEAGDWALISMQPFTSEETLTVTMKDGEQFTVKVTDGQLHTYVISDSGDTYEVIVTYDDTAEIPEDAELVVKEIPGNSKKYAKNIDLVNKELKTKEESEVTNPVQFDISIVSGTKEVEPKEGSIVTVEIRLAKSMFGEEVSEEEENSSKEDSAAKDSAASQAENEKSKESEEEMGFLLFNGQEIKVESGELEGCRIAHITEDGTAEIIDEVENSAIDDKLVMQFETTSFSDYLFDGTNGNGLGNLPDTIYVGDEIYFYNQDNMWVTGIGSVVTETKLTASNNNQNLLKTVTAIAPGEFRIGNSSNWGHFNDGNSKRITVLSARTGTTPPNTIQTVDNSSIGLTMNLFDYDLNNYLDDYFNGSSHNENPLSTFAGSGINQNNALKFWGSGIGNNYGGLNQYVEHGVTSIVNTTLNTSGYPVLSNNSGGSGNRDLSYLFTLSNGTDKEAYTNVNGLFKKVGDYYVYDSNENYAYYDKTQGNGGSFAVYERTYEQKSRGDGGEQATHGAVASALK